MSAVSTVGSPAARTRSTASVLAARAVATAHRECHAPAAGCIDHRDCSPAQGCCDLYSSTAAVFDALRPLIQPGLVIVFDELFNYPEFLEGELKALWELLSARPDLSLEVVGTSTRNINSASDYRPGQLGWLRTQLGRYQSCAVRLTASKRPQRRRQLRLP